MTTKIKGTGGVEFPDSTVQGSAAYTKAESDGPAFFASQTGTGQGITANVSDIVTFTDVIFDTASDFSTGVGSEFQPSVPGYYQVSWNIMFSPNATGSSTVLSSLKRSGVEIAKGDQSTASLVTGGQFTTQGSALVYMNGTTDYLQVMFISTLIGGVLVASVAPGINTYFSGFLARKA